MRWIAVSKPSATVERLGVRRGQVVTPRSLNRHIVNLRTRAFSLVLWLSTTRAIPCKKSFCGGISVAKGLDKVTIAEDDWLEEP